MEAIRIMTGNGFDRLSAIERLQEINQQQINSNSQAIAANSAEISELRRSIDVLAEAAGRTLRSVELLREAAVRDRERQEQDRLRFEQHQQEFRETIARIDRALDYLIRRDIGRGRE
jgi:hypothetical protein